MSSFIDEFEEIQAKEPKYIHVKRELVKQIKTGLFSPENPIPSESELMRKFGVSRFTVRQAIKDLVHEGLLYTEQGKGTFICPNGKKQPLSNKIGLLSMAIDTYIFPEIINGILRAIKNSDYQLVLAHTQYSHEQEKLELLKLIKQGIAGLIVESTLSAESNPNLDLLCKLREMGVPIVQIDSRIDELDTAYVILDDEAGGYMAGKYLSSLGHKNVAMVYNSTHLPAVLRMKGFVRAMAENGVSVPARNIRSFERRFSTKTDVCYRLTREMLAQADRPTAIFFFNDESAIEGCQAIWDCGLNIPKDISIVGFDDSDLAKLAQVHLTTLTHPKARLGESAMTILMEIMQNPSIEPIQTSHKIVFQPELVVRDSCRRI